MKTKRTVKKLDVTERIVDFKRHTIGYVVNGTELSRTAVIDLARRGWIKGVKVIYRGQTPHLVGEQKRLYDLPIQVGW